MQNCRDARNVTLVFLCLGLVRSSAYYVLTMYEIVAITVHTALYVYFGRWVGCAPPVVPKIV